MIQENKIEEITKLIDRHLVEVLPGGVWQTCTNPKHLVREIVKNLGLLSFSEERAEVFELLQQLLDNNMCSVVGDELIKQYMKSKT